MKVVKVFMDDLKVEKKREILSEMGLKKPEEGGYDKEPISIIRVPDELQIRITKGAEVLNTWTVGEEETDDGGCDFYCDVGFSGIEEALEDAFELILEPPEPEEEKDVRLHNIH